MMKYVAVLALCAAAFGARTMQGDATLFADFKATYGKAYAAAEEARAFTCFRSNLDAIEARNADGRLGVHGVNQFTDMCEEDFKLYHNLQMPANKTYNFAPRKSVEAVKKALASSVDWRQKGAVTHVKNQGQCGSCWSFSTTGNIEGQWQQAGHDLVALSEEELVQCSHNGNNGCGGGLMDNAFQWVIQNGGIDSESDYPYTSGTGRNGNCNEMKKSKDVAKISSFHDVAHEEEQMLAYMSQHGPLSVAVDAAQHWQTYQGGIVSNCNGRQLDHGVLIVGYGESMGQKYWIVKNSWGASWGENGYIRLAFGSNQCGLNQAPSSSVV